MFCDEASLLHGEASKSNNQSEIPKFNAQNSGKFQNPNFNRRRRKGVLVEV
jgi:hypothetical protein